MAFAQDDWLGRSLGQYRIVRKLGAGGMGVVFLAEDGLLKRHVAVKVLARDEGDGPQSHRAFLREAQIAAGLNHPHIVTVHAVDRHAAGDQARFYVVMEHMEGGSAQDRLRAPGGLPWQEATRLIAEACRGLDAAHAAGLVHRDIKPSNLLLRKDGTVKIGDFGLARFVESSTMNRTDTGKIAGTPSFMSPEQCRAEPLDARSDIYSLGATYFTLLTGKYPYDADQPMQTMFAHCSSPVPDPSRHARLPERCRDIVQWAMAKDPIERYQAAIEMLADLGKLLDEAYPRTRVLTDSPAMSDGGTWLPPGQNSHVPDTIPVRRAVSTARVPPRSRRAALIGICIACVLLAVLMYWQPWRQSSSSPNLNGSSTPGDFPADIPAKGVVFHAGGRVGAVAFSPDGQILAASFTDSLGKDKPAVKLWDVRTGKLERGLLKGRGCHALAFTKDGKLVVGAEGKRALKIIELQKGEVIEELETFSGDGHVRVIAASRDGRWLGAGLEPYGKGDNVLRVWSLTTRQPIILKGEGHKQSIYTLAFSPDGNYMATGGQDKRVKLWSMVERALLQTFDVPGTGISPAVAFSFDRRLLAYSGKSSVYLRSVPDGQQLAEIDLDHRQATWIAFSPVAPVLAVATSDWIDVLDVSEPVRSKRLARFEPPDVWRLAFSADGRYLASAGHRDEIGIFPVKTKD